MAQIFNDMPLGSSLGSNLASGLGAGLQQLAQHKMNQIQNQKIQQMFSQYPKPVADLLTFAAQNDPKNLYKYLQLLGQQPSEPQVQQSIQTPLQELGAPQKMTQEIQEKPTVQEQPIAAQATQEKPNVPDIREQIQQEQLKQQKLRTQAAEQKQENAIAQAIASGNKKEEVELKNQEKKIDQLLPVVNTLEDILSTTRRMKENLKAGSATPNYLASIGAKIAPGTLLSKGNELFDKDAAHLVNLKLENIKGIPTKIRILLQEREKPGLNHSKEVNEEILDRIEKETEQYQNKIYKQYPFMKEFASEDIEPAPKVEEVKPQVAAQSSEKLPDPSKFKEGTIIKKGNVRKQKVNGQWKDL